MGQRCLSPLALSPLCLLIQTALDVVVCWAATRIRDVLNESNNSASGDIFLY